MVKNLISALLEHADLLEQATSLPRLVERQGTCFPGAVSVLYEWIHTAMPPKQTSDPTTLLMFLSQQKKNHCCFVVISQPEQRQEEQA